jgi:hypothetical protein
MKTPFAVVLVLFIFAGTCHAQDKRIRISITAKSNVSEAEIGKALNSHCPDVSITVDPEKADYLLEAIDTGAGPARKPYKFSLFNHGGDYVFSTQTARADNSVKDVCKFIEKQKG